MIDISGSGGCGRSYRPGAQSRTHRSAPGVHRDFGSGKWTRPASLFADSSIVDAFVDSSPRIGEKYRPVQGALRFVLLPAHERAAAQ